MKTQFLVRSTAAAGLIAIAGLGLARFDNAWMGRAQAATPPSATLVAAAPATPTVALPNFTTLVQRYGPAVVNITVTQKSQRTGFDFRVPSEQDDPFSQFFRGFQSPFNGLRPHEEITRGLGSGFIVSSDGYIL